ncbi:MAG: FecR domain-containing protein [Betaproteobacteria bacterium]|nr:FecR domain-containing protein [Betaproteobacteria bacterium]MBP6644404.1 FecR domain-containing protein [Burkholderiaceae bacterium]
MTHHRFALAISFVCASSLAQDNSFPRLRASTQLALNNPVLPADQATEPVGHVKTVTGVAQVITNGKSVKALLGTPIMQGSVLKTGADSSLGVSFKDSTIMSFGPMTELTVTEYLYSPADGKLKFGSKLTRGTLNYVSGVIAKLKPDGVTVTTPTGLIGVRGTHFVAKVDPVDAEGTSE